MKFKQWKIQKKIRYCGDEEYCVYRFVLGEFCVFGFFGIIFAVILSIGVSALNPWLFLLGLVVFPPLFLNIAYRLAWDSLRSFNSIDAAIDHIQFKKDLEEKEKSAKKERYYL